MKLKRFLAITICALLAASLFSACAGSSTPASSGDAPVSSEAASTAPAVAPEDLDSAQLSGTLTYWCGFSGDSMTWDQWRVDEFMKEFPDITIDVQYVPESAGIRNGKLLSAIAGGTAPDLICADDYVSAFGYAGQGAFESWDPYLAGIDLKVEDFMPGFKNLMQYGGVTYLLPQDSNVIMLYINTDMAAEAGLDVANYPKTIDELNDWGDKLTVIGADGSLEKLGFVPWLDTPLDEPFFWPFMFGSDVYNSEADTLELTDQGVVDSLNWMRDYANKYGAENVRGFTQAAGGLFSPDHPFFTGKLGLMFVGNWATNALKIYAPDINYICVPIPTPPTGRVESTTLGSNVFAMPTGVKEPELAAAFFKFTQRAEINGDNFDNWRSIPTVDAVFDDVSWTKSGDEIYALERKLANSPQTGHPALCSVSALMRADMIALRDDVIYNNSDPLPLLEALQTKMQAELDKA